LAAMDLGNRWHPRGKAFLLFRLPIALPSPHRYLSLGCRLLLTLSCQQKSIQSSWHLLIFGDSDFCSHPLLGLPSSIMPFVFVSQEEGEGTLKTKIFVTSGINSAKNPHFAPVLHG
jgi:hypothetical protein